MRIGSNPNKNLTLKQNDFFHQIIIPVYIPHEDDYFKDSFTILQHCLNSIFKTIHSKTYISIVNNGSCNKVREYLDHLFQKKFINEVIHTDNIGKVNAVLKGLVGHSFSYVTISDSDVMFLNNWQTETYEVYNQFPFSGVVGITPVLNTNYYLTSNIIYKNFFNKKIEFSEIINEKAMRVFYKSINQDKEFIDTKVKKSLIIKNNNFTANIGSGHYVATYKGDIFENIKKFSNYKLGGDIEFQLDKLALKKGYWRLNTHDNFAYHMGNTNEPWMEKELAFLKNSEFEDSISFSEKKDISKFRYFIENKLFQKIFNKKWVRKFYENWKSE